MPSKIKNLTFFLILAVVAAGASYADILAINKYNEDIQSLVPQMPVTHIATGSRQALRSYQYIGGNFEIGFKYPQVLSVDGKGAQVVLSHAIPFVNHGDCDMKGDEQEYPNLEDFHVAIQVASGTVASAVRDMSPYMPAENFSGNTLKVSPGFIDPVTIGSWTGFGIYEGAEGCGHTIYYFPAGNGRVLVITKNMVQALSGVMSSNIKEEILKVPGAISPEQSDAIFKAIVESLKLSPAAGAAGTAKWDT